MTTIASSAACTESDLASISPAASSRTPALLLGPYYPLKPQAGAGSALWRGDRLPSGARRLTLDGRVLDRRADPVVGAEVELWQADPCGRYRHPSAPDSALVPEGFAGYGRTRTDHGGAFRFTSLVPGAYTAGDEWRAPHLHLQITGCFDRLVTQLFLPRHPGNTQDRWYRALLQPHLLTPEVLASAPDGDGLHLLWTAVLTRG
jgi:protocatechuate 3,4-dioxygenase, beta subunit